MHAFRLFRVCLSAIRVCLPTIQKKKSQETREQTATLGRHHYPRRYWTRRWWSLLAHLWGHLRDPAALAWACPPPAGPGHCAGQERAPGPHRSGAAPHAPAAHPASGAGHIRLLFRRQAEMAQLECDKTMAYRACIKGVHQNDIQGRQGCGDLGGCRGLGMASARHTERGGHQ